MLADLHIHSKYSRATSKELTLQNLEKYARIKGIELLGSGDFTHPLWRQEIRDELKEDGQGMLRSKDGFPFILSTEISLVYTQSGKGRRVHLVIFAPNLEVGDKITEYLGTLGRLDYDGRPIFGRSVPEVVGKIMSLDPLIEIFPAHIWTPWFSMFGSKSGFDTVKDCFQDETKHIHAIETGLSSDPPMNWRLSQLDKYAILSFSDLHSYWPWRIGRECTQFDMAEESYPALISAIRSGNVDYTIEVDPSYGKYHFDGHRNCNTCLSPEDTKNNQGMCPVCKKPVTVGVLSRVEDLADRPNDYVDSNRPPFYSLLPLSELIALTKGTGVATRGVWKVYQELLARFQSEYNILLHAAENELLAFDDTLGKLIRLNRQGKIGVQPGYDGEYGVPVMGDFVEKKKPIKSPQKSLAEF